MEQIYNINRKESSTEEYQIFDLKEQNATEEYSPMYIEVLSVFREVFQKIDFSQIIKQKR